ncbi:DsbA family oxidoreductase [Ramlibacter ginsenosidimutans]|uniref:DsbA family oxidoreductase n=1 Tax=Ramlibacter ginsenosidimutans TaxID=502333 RepID=A0A934TW67_9BURK|nr:DsbA family oxidoreductase [Ramlibacter ginsenosidimutans]MBK6008558.1 DsbA family oxidoreductase [Ramlibacter ginsenosidimutans]
MTQPLHIDFVSDVACPWCAVGLASLEQALRKLDGEVAVDLHFQPFELNPQMGPEGQDVTEHIAQKYGATPEQQAKNRENIAQRGAAVGFQFRKEGRGRVWNTFDAHRLLYWAGEQGAQQQRDLKMALLKAYHGEARNVADPAVLAEVAASVGLDRQEAADVLASGRYADEVRAQEEHFQGLGIHAVPSVIINNRHLIQGGQPPEMFEQALRQLAEQATA